MAVFIVAVAMTVGGLTLPNSYAGTTPPPNIAQLSMLQIVAGLGLLVLGMVIVATAVALLADLRRSRPLAVASTAIAGLLAAAAFVLVASASHRDVILLAALGVAALAFGGAAIVLGRPRP